MRSCSANNCCYPVFGTDKNTRLGYCKMHQSLRTDRDTRTVFQKHMDKMKESGKEVKINEDDLAKWFEDGMKDNEKVCENCGKSLKNYNKNDWRGSQHHVLEKSLYPSVATNPINRLILGKWCCHHVWHQSWEKASQMKIFKKAVDIVRRLFPLLNQDEKRKLPDVLVQEIPPEIFNGQK